MMRQWIVYSLFVGTLLALAAAAIDAGCRALRVPTRWVWVTALALLAAFAASVPFRSPSVSMDRVVIDRATQAFTAPSTSLTPMQQMAAGWNDVQGALTRASDLVLPAVVRALPARVDRALSLLWIVASLVIMVFFLVAYLRMRIAVRGWPRSTLHDVEVRVAPNTGPAVVGFVRPEIVLPKWIVMRSWEEQRLVLAHESAHRRAGDHILLALGCLAAVALPWNPVVWWMLSRLRLAVELDCDRRVLAREATPGTYGAMLIDLAGRCSGFRLGAPAFADGTSHLERRIVAMTMKRSSSPNARAAGLALAACAALLVACEAHVPTGPEINRMDARAAEKVAVRLVSDTAPAAYYVNGIPTKAADAMRIPADSISQIEVHKSKGGDHAEILIATKSAISTAAGKPVELWTATRHGDGSVSAVKLWDGARPDSARFLASVRVRGGATPAVIFIDGVRSDAAGLRKLSPLGIRSMEVIKGALARRRYPSEPDAVNGVILVTTWAPAGGER